MQRQRGFQAKIVYKKIFSYFCQTSNIVHFYDIVKFNFYRCSRPYKKHLSISNTFMFNILFVQSCDSFQS